MYLVVTESLHPNTSSPLWLVTLWATAYFTHLVTSSLVFREIDEYKIFDRYFTLILLHWTSIIMKISGEESVFTIYLLLGPLLVEERKFCPDWYKVSSSGVGWKDLEYWKVVLILEEILVFMTDQFILEPYFPDLFARQFGLCEDIPIPLLAIYNHQGISIGLLSPFEVLDLM